MGPPPQGARSARDVDAFPSSRDTPSADGVETRPPPGGASSARDGEAPPSPHEVPSTWPLGPAPDGRDWPAAVLSPLNPAALDPASFRAAGLAMPPTIAAGGLPMRGCGRGSCSPGYRFLYTHCVKTTLDLNDQLLASAKALAAQQRTSLTRLIEEGLQLRMRVKTAEPGRPRSRLPVFKGRGGLVAGVDPRSNKAMFEALGDDA